MLLNVAIFMWYGAVCPWQRFLANDVVPISRLVALGILVLLLRRLPWVLAVHRRIPQIKQVRQAVFVGFFGPIGVSAIFYLYITNEFLATMKGADGELRADVAKLPEAVEVIVWFLCICSVVSFYLFSLPLGASCVSIQPRWLRTTVVVSFLVSPQALPEIKKVKHLQKPHLTCLQIQVVHGLSIPFGKLGYHLPRTLSRSVTDGPDGSAAAAFHIGSRVNSIGLRFSAVSSSRRPSEDRPRTAGVQSPAPSRANSVRSLWRIGGSVIKDARRTDEEGGRTTSGTAQGGGVEGPGASVSVLGGDSAPAAAFVAGNRTIRFPDEDRDAGGVRGRGDAAATASSTAISTA